MSIENLTGGPAEQQAGHPVPSWTAGWGTDELRLDDYLRRIGDTGPLEPTAETLRRLHRAHVAAIAFENIDVALGRGISLHLPDVQRKLVDQGRGGYCFEHNLLFAAVLERLGFPVTRLQARVRRGNRDQIRYRAHAMLVAAAGFQPWLADVGFGDEGLLEPVPLAHEATVKAGGWTWRVVRERDQWVLQSLHPEGWFDLYSLRVEQHFPADFEVANFYTAHSDRSTFTGKLIAMRGSEEARHVLRDRELSSRYPDGRTERTGLTAAEVLTELAGTFGIRLGAEEARLLERRLASAAS
ncbi:arylamine N-acetyltransferase family protein [Streptomyces aidingensis]|uniref:N-hydroxyarylamine O-acetyltransferase n=1 Tax=Streptomyces aidingensis TaxID=910347 RepID=A0A1I1FFC3_9ACTN|nr:arylamine N-acetyltransferase [Streptomyces aidingensis]SFB98159.1 N-hydroxyarylamine O-acetyltransferase [Streptomyces aidingensis]